MMKCQVIKSQVIYRQNSQTKKLDFFNDYFVWHLFWKNCKMERRNFFEKSCLVTTLTTVTNVTSVTIITVQCQISFFYSCRGNFFTKSQEVLSKFLESLTAVFGKFSWHLLKVYESC